jgi:succinylarginine dihydrolase
MVVVFDHRAPGASTPTACAVSNANDARAATTAKMRVIVTLCFFVLLPVLRTFVELERCVETSMNDPAKVNRIVEQANLLRGAYYARSGSLSSLAFVHRYIEVRAD